MPEPRMPSAAVQLPPMVLAAILLAGCAGTPHATERPTRDPARVAIPTDEDLASGEPIEPIEPRVYAVFGRTLVIPVRVSGRFQTADVIQARLDDGRAVPARMFRFVAARSPVVGGWVPDAGVWSGRPASKGATLREGEQSVHAVLVDLPFDAVGQGVWIQKQRVALTWLPEPPMLSAALKMTDEQVRWPEAATAWSDPRLPAMVEAERTSPLRRWRYRLLSGTLGQATQAEPLPAEVLRDAFEDPIVEAWARQREDRWMVALKRLRSTDPALAEDLVNALRRTAQFPGDVVAPAWTPDEGRTEDLLRALLDPDLTERGRVERARLWLSEEPRAAAWVVDDAGVPDAASGESLPKVALLNLSARGQIGVVSLAGKPAAADMTAIGPARTEVVLLTPEPQSARAPAALPVVLGVGEWSRRDAIAAYALAVPDSGLRLGPFWPDWTLASFLAAAPARATAGEDTAAMLFTHTGGARTIHVECAAPGGRIGPDESVTLFLGPAGAGSVAIRADAGGAVVPVGYAPGVRVVTEGGRMIAQFEVPEEAIEPGGVLRVGLVRGDGRGRRWGWPRPMLPWDDEPGRVAVRLGADVEPDAEGAR